MVMKYKKFKTLNNEELSAVGYGCWPIGGTWNHSDDLKSIETIRTALDLGVNFFDVAPVYGMGHSEEILGKAIKGYDRKKIFIATKCGLVWDENSEEKIVTKSISRESLYKELNVSLKRLGTDYIDLYQIHWPFENMQLDEALKTFEEMKEKGLIRYAGLSNFSKKDLEYCMSKTDIATYQGIYNLLDPNAETYHHKQLEYRSGKEILPVCRENRMAFLAYSPLFQGLLTGKFKVENNFDENDDRFKNPKLKGEMYQFYYKAAEELKELAAEIGKPLSQLSINWLVNQEEVGPVICGAQTPEEIKENVESLSWELTEDIENKINLILKKYNID